MKLETGDLAIVYEAARCAGTDAAQLARAIESESVPDVAAVLNITIKEASERLGPLQRAMSIGDDWGAGCKLLTDDVRQAIRDALRNLFADPHGAASPDSSPK